jgi:hypothetical protein
MDRTNHYERAFEAYLQEQRLCYVAVDESRRAPLDEGRIKSLDFVVCGANGARLLIDIKGRRYPGGKPGRERRVWECWSTREDVAGLLRWGQQFGPAYQGLLVFTYRLSPEVLLPEDTPDLWSWRDNRYLFRAVAIADYQRSMRVRSPKWGTVTLPQTVFRRLVRPLHHFTHGLLEIGGEGPALRNPSSACGSSAIGYLEDQDNFEHLTLDFVQLAADAVSTKS